MIEKKTSKTAQDGQQQEKTMMQKFEEDVKSSIFNVIYILLKDDETTFWKFFLIIIIDFFQILLYSFHPNISDTWEAGNVMGYIHTFLNFFHFVPWLKEIDLVTYLVIFYICVSIVALIILDFFYVTYSQTRKKFSFAWPIQGLRTICFLIKTILYLPFLVCQDKNGQSVHYAFQDYECWTGQHIIHAAMAILSIIIFVVLSMIACLTHYKPLSSSSDATARINSRTDAFVMIEKTIFVISFAYLKTYEYQWILISIVNVMSIIACTKFYIEQPYHNERLMTLIIIQSGIFAWANIVLFITKVLYFTSFTGGLQLFLLGIPLIIALMLFKKENRIDQLLKNVSSFLVQEEVQKQARYFLQLISAKDTDRNADIILKGYVYQHEDTCPNPTCQLKQFKANLLNTNASKNSKEKKKKQFQQQQLQMMQNVDNQQLLLQHAKNMYRMGIQKFPISSSLRIQYAFFLIEKMNNKQEALQELTVAANLNPSFDEQFIIYRYRKLAEEYGDTQSVAGGGFGEVKKSNRKTNQDIMTKFAYESTLRQLQIHIERCAQFHLEFWNLLRDDRPDVAKLGECGTRINLSINHVDAIWNQLQTLNSNVPKALRLYGKYLIDILHDKEGGQDLMARAKDAANIKNNYYDGGMNMLEDLNDIQQMSSDGTPCIYVAGDLDKIGMITQSNAGATRIFGYQPLEIKNHNVEKLMPEMYAKNHSKVLEDALMKGPENIPNKERLVFARHKSGYIFPVWLQLKMVQNLSNGVQFVAMFKVDKKLMSSQIGFVLLNREKKIQGISSSCMKMMNLDIPRMRRMTAYGYDLNKLAPELFNGTEELYNYSNKQASIIEWTVPKFERIKSQPLPKQGTIREGGRGSKDMNSRFQSQGLQPRQFQGQGSLNPNQTGNNDQDSNPFNINGRTSIKFNPGASSNAPLGQQYTITEQKFTFSCSVNTIIMGELGEIGYYIRIDQLQEAKKKQDFSAPIVGSRRDIKTLQSREKMRQPLFQFRFDSDSGKFIREIKDNLYIDNANKDPNFINGHYVGNYIDFGNQSSPKSVNKSDDGTPKDRFLNVKDAKIDVSQQDSKDGAALNTSAEQQSPIDEDLHQARRRWGKGISIYILVNGKFQTKDHDEEIKKEKQIEEERKRKLMMEEQNFLQLDNFKNNIKSRKALHLAINDTTVPPAIRNLRMTMNFVIMCLLALAITEFTIITGAFKDINENFNLIHKSYERVSEFQRVAYNVRSLVLINENRLTNLGRYSTQSDFQDFLKKDTESALNNIYSIQNEISLSTLDLSATHNDLLNLKIVPLYYKESNTTFKILNFSLTESVLQLSSAVFTVRHLKNTDFYELQEDVYFVTYNLFNDFLIMLRKSSDFYLTELMDRANDKNTYILILFVCSAGLVIISMPILFPAVSSVNKAKVHVLSLFVDIPNHYVIDLGNRCEEFLNSYHDEQKLDEMQSEDNQSQNNLNDGETQGGSQTIKRHIHKEAKNTAHSNRNFFIQFSLAVVVVIGYFLAMFILGNNYVSDIQILAKELTLATKLESYFAFSQNVQREMLYNRNKKILNTNSFNVSKDAIDYLYSYTQDLLDSHQSNRGLLNEDYQAKFDEILNGNLCQNDLIQLSLIPQQCSLLFSNASIHGLQSVLTQYYETLRQTLTIVRLLNNTASSNTTVTATKGIKNAAELLNSQFFVDLYLMQFRFIQDTFRTLETVLKDAVNSDFQSSIDTRISAFIVYIMGIVIAYLILWTPFLSKLNREVSQCFIKVVKIWRTKSMLTIIPIEIIMKIPKIQEYLNKQAMFNSKNKAK